MSLPLVVVANESEKKEAKKIFKGHKIKIIGEGFYQILVNLKSINKKTPIINFGMAGSAGYKIGQRVTIGVSKLLETNYPLNAKPFKLSNTKVICYTGNSFVLKNETKDSKCVFDMELYYIIALGYNVIKSVKVISDNLDLKQYKKTKK